MTDLIRTSDAMNGSRRPYPAPLTKIELNNKGSVSGRRQTTAVDGPIIKIGRHCDAIIRSVIVASEQHDYTKEERLGELRRARNTLHLIDIALGEEIRRIK